MTATRHDGSGTASTSRIYERTDGAGAVGWANSAVDAEVAQNGELQETPRAAGAGYVVGVE